MNIFGSVEGRVGVMGDNHGSFSWLKHVIETMEGEDISHVLHLGDFGLWHGNAGKKYLERTQKLLTEKDMFLVVTLGNHENYVMVESMVEADLDPNFNQRRYYDRILFARRGQRWIWGGRSFLSLGGANSIDRYYRTPNVDWWEGEQISLGDAYRSIEGGHADVMLTHDVPAGVPIVGEMHKVKEPMIWAPADLEYAQGSRAILRQVVDVVRPDLLLHGHYHFRKEFFTELTADMGSGSEEYVLRSICFEMENYNSNFGILDLADLSVS